jgi:hypothetical protein
MRLLILAVILLVITGCTNKSQNLRLAGIDASVSLGITGALERVPDTQFVQVKTKIKTICEELIIFIDSGALADLPKEDVKQKLIAEIIKRNYIDYLPILDTVFVYVDSVKIAVPQNQITQMIKAGLESAARNAGRCTIEGKL